MLILSYLFLLFAACHVINFICKLHITIKNQSQSCYVSCCQSFISCTFHGRWNLISGKRFLTHLWSLGPRVCLLSHMLSVCQLLFCCPPLLTFIHCLYCCCFLCGTMSAKTTRSKSQSRAVNHRLRGLIW